MSAILNAIGLGLPATSAFSSTTSSSSSSSSSPHSSSTYATTPAASTATATTATATPSESSMARNERRSNVLIVLCAIAMLLPAAYFVSAMCSTLVQADATYTPTFNNSRLSLVNGSVVEQFTTFSYSATFNLFNATDGVLYTYYASPFNTPVSMASCEYTVYSRIDSWRGGYPVSGLLTLSRHAPHCGTLTLYRAALIGLALLWIPFLNCSLWALVLSQPDGVARSATQQQLGGSAEELASPSAAVLSPSGGSGSAAAEREGWERPLLHRWLSSRISSASQRTAAAARKPPSLSTQATRMGRAWRGVSVVTAMMLLLSLLSIVAAWKWATDDGFVNGQWMPMLPALSAILGVQWPVIALSLWYTHRDLKRRLTEMSSADATIKTSLWHPCC